MAPTRKKGENLTDERSGEEKKTAEQHNNNKTQWNWIRAKYRPQNVRRK